MTLNSVQSKAISHLGYDKEKRELHVRFKTGSRVYVFPGVGPDEHQSLVNAESIGAYFQKHFSGRKHK